MGLIYGEFPETAARLILSAALRKLPQLAKRLFPVSYTHLTLPTNSLV